MSMQTVLSASLCDCTGNPSCHIHTGNTNGLDVKVHC